MPGSLVGQVAIVTGGGRGFGRAIALRLAQEGASVTVTARTVSELEETVHQIEENGGNALAVDGTVTRRGDVERVVQETREAFGPVTLLVNNAGIPDPFGPIGTVDPEQWWKAQEVHIKAPYLYMHAVVPGMIENHAGRIINIVGAVADMVVPNLTAYCLGKSAIVRLTQLLSAEVRQHDLSVFAIDPGFVITALAEKTMASPEARRWLPAMVARLKARKDEDDDSDLARCQQRCVDLASGDFDLLSGQYIKIDDELDELILHTESDDITILPPDQ